MAHILHLLGRERTVVNRNAANLSLEEVADALIDKDRSDGKVRAIVTNAIGEVVWILNLTQSIGLALETCGVVDKLLLALLEQS